VVVISAPFTAKSPAVVIFPFVPAMDQLVAVTSFAPKERAVSISASERSIPISTVPASD
jgi:hypothetical protein